MERLLYLRRSGFETYKQLEPVADKRLKSLHLALESPVSVLGDASFSMDVAISMFSTPLFLFRFYLTPPFFRVRNHYRLRVNPFDECRLEGWCTFIFALLFAHRNTVFPLKSFTPCGRPTKCLSSTTSGNGDQGNRIDSASVCFNGLLQTKESCQIFHCGYRRNREREVPRPIFPFPFHEIPQGLLVYYLSIGVGLTV